MLERHPHDEAAALKVVISAGEYLYQSRVVNSAPFLTLFAKATSFAFMILDFVWLTRDEAKHVWP